MLLQPFCNPLQLAFEPKTGTRFGHASISDRYGVGPGRRRSGPKQLGQSRLEPGVLKNAVGVSVEAADLLVKNAPLRERETSFRAKCTIATAELDQISLVRTLPGGIKPSDRMSNHCVQSWRCSNENQI